MQITPSSLVEISLKLPLGTFTHQRLLCAMALRISHPLVCFFKVNHIGDNNLLRSNMGDILRDAEEAITLETDNIGPIYG